MSIEKTLAQETSKALKELYGVEIDPQNIQIQTTRKEFEGNYTIVVFPFLKQSRKSPEETGKEIGNMLVKNSGLISGFNVVKGFLNLNVSNNHWIDTLNRIASEEKFGFIQLPDKPELVMVEYSSPNTNKPLHLGHVRNNLLGFSLAKILEANGKKVIKTNIVNDRGIHICKSMLAWQKWGDGITPESSGKKGDHLIGDFYVEFDRHYKDELKRLEAEGLSEEEAAQKSALMEEAREMLRKWEAGDPEIRGLWKKMNGWVYSGFDETYNRLGVSFDKIYYESDTYLEGKELVTKGLEEGKMYKKADGSVWADLTPEGLDHKLLLRSDGTSVYITQDIGTAKLRYRDYPIHKMIYVVGNEQNYHFQVLSILLDRLGFSWGKDLTHFSYGMVELPEGKMKSREGTVVDADDLIDTMIESAREASADRFEDMTAEEAADISRMVGLGALKYFLLKVDPKKNMLFNPKESIDFNGNTGPFLQYTYARIRSILRKAGQFAEQTDTSVEPGEKEIALIQKISEFPQVVKDAGENYSPALIANYAYELAKEFNQFYHDYPILKEEDKGKREMRLRLSKITGRTLKDALGLLGIEAPERM